MKKILFTIGLKLKERQEQQLLRFFQYLSTIGYSIQLLAPLKENSVLFPYIYRIPKKSSVLKRLRRIIAGRYYFFASGFNHHKWKARYRVWSGTQSATEEESDKKYRNHFFLTSILLNEINPDYFFCWNPLSCYYGMMYELAMKKKIESRVMESGLLSESIFFERKSIGVQTHFSTCSLKELGVEQSFDKYLSRGEDWINSRSGNETGLYVQKTASDNVTSVLNQRASLKILVLGLSEVENGIIPYDDPDRKSYLPYFRSNLDVVSHISELLPESMVLFKPHPLFNTETEDRVLKQNARVLNINPEELIAWADVVVCFGTKMELNVLLKNKPVVLAGTGLLWNKGICYDAGKKADLIPLLHEAAAKGISEMQHQNLKAFLGYLCSGVMLAADVPGAIEYENRFFKNFETEYLN